MKFFPFGLHVLERAEYKRIYLRLKEKKQLKPNSGLVVMGQPGIGMWYTAHMKDLDCAEGRVVRQNNILLLPHNRPDPRW